MDFSTLAFSDDLIRKYMEKKCHNKEENDCCPLWYRVLLQAIIDIKYFRSIAKKTPKGKAAVERYSAYSRWGRDSVMWVISDSWEIGSYNWICNLLDINQLRLRKRILGILDDMG